MTESTDHVRSGYTVAIASGKGGVGKSNVAVNLSLALRELGYSVALLDASLGLGNIDLLCGLNGYWNLSHVMTGARDLMEIVLDGPSEIQIIPGATGLKELADCPPAARKHLVRQLSEVEQSHDFLIIDTSTGIHNSVRQFLTAADLVFVVTTGEPTSITNSYATIKSLAISSIHEEYETRATPRIEVVVNQVDSQEQYDKIADNVRKTSRMFLHSEVEAAGYIPQDVNIPAGVMSRKPFFLSHPGCPAAAALRRLAKRVEAYASHRSTPGQYFSRLLEPHEVLSSTIPIPALQNTSELHKLTPAA